MAIDPTSQAVLMIHRLGFAPRPGALSAFASDPRGACLAELGRPGAGTIAASGLPSSGEAARAAFEFRQQRRAARLAARAERERVNQSGLSGPMARPADASSSMGSAQAQPNGDRGAPAMPGPGPGVPQQLYLQDAKARIDAALRAEIGFVERLVWFWSNHFCVSADKGPFVRAIAGAFEREAIRPHVLGRFSDMLIAVETHPAMLRYLDNVRSIGPNSVVGGNREAGLNENLAREILELHTLGVRSVYDQSDVTSFARVITGWSVTPFRQDMVRGGEFAFNPRRHEPGPQSVIGRIYRAAGMDQGLAVLEDLAHHPATAQHIAKKLATHFVADSPPPALVDRLTKRFLQTKGDLKELARMLVFSDEVGQAPRQKLKRPGEWIVGAMRASGYAPTEIGPIVQAHNLLGEPLWRPPAPKGFSDDSAAWMDGVSQRLDIANQLSRRVASLMDADAAIDSTLGSLASRDTRQSVRRAESRQQAWTLLFMSPEFQRR